MPALLDPTRNKFPVVLEADRGKIPEPTFFIRVLSLSEFDEKLAAMRDSKTAGDVVSVLTSLVGGWCDVDKFFTADRLPEILSTMLTRPEVMELLALAFDGNRLSETERKKLELQRSCAAESCVSHAAEVVATYRPKSFTPS